MAKDAQTGVTQKVMDTLKKDLPNIIKDNKGAAVGLVAGFLLADYLKENQNVMSALLGGLVGHAVDEKKKDKEF